VPGSIHDELIADAAEHAPVETGGVLLGQRDDHSVSVTHLILGGPGAKRLPERFEPDSEWQRREIERIYAAENGNLEYLGDWHSHPRGGALSRLDHQTARAISGFSPARCPSPVFLVVKFQSVDWQVFAYRYFVGRLRASRIATD
jgi:integrative and conjugative element protein (TIGR02256 family)